MFYSEELSGPIFTKIAQKLAFESTKRSHCSDFKFSIFGPRLLFQFIQKENVENERKMA